MISRERWVILALCLLFCAAHVAGYLTFTIRWFGYRGYRFLLWEDPTQIVPILGMVAPILLAPALFLPTQNRRLSDLAPWVLYVTLYVPGVYIPLLTLGRPASEVIVLSILHLVGLIAFEMLRRVKLNVKFAKTQNSSWVPGVVLPAIALLIALYFWQAVDFRLDLAWDTLYERRFAARDLVGPGMPMGYLNQMFIKVFIPAIALFAWLWKDIRLGALCLFCIVVSWAFDANKLVIFTPILIIGVLSLYKSKKPVQTLLIALTIMILLFIPVYFLIPGQSSGTSIAAEIAEGTVKRALYEPGLLTGYYWDHFQIYPLNNFGGSPLSVLFTKSPYETIVPRRIGYMYFGNDAETANAGIMAGAISDLGNIGVPIMMGIAGLILRIFECLGEQRNRALGYAFIFVITQDWSNRPFQTSLITGGVLASFLLLWLYSDPKKRNAAPGTEAATASPAADGA